MKIDLVTTLALLFCLGACSQMQKSDDESHQPMEMTAMEVTDEDLEDQLEKAEKGKKTESSGNAPTAAELEASPLPESAQKGEPVQVEEENEPPVPAVSTPKKAKGPMKADLKFKWGKASGKVAMIENKKGTQLAFSGSGLKKGLYTFMLEDSCKASKGKKSKPKKMGQFNVKKPGKFSTSITAKSLQLSKVKGKGLSVYFGPKAKTRLDCSTIR